MRTADSSDPFGLANLVLTMPQYPIKFHVAVVVEKLSIVSNQKQMIWAEDRIGINSKKRLAPFAHTNMYFTLLRPRKLVPYPYYVSWLHSNSHKLSRLGYVFALGVAIWIVLRDEIAPIHARPVRVQICKIVVCFDKDFIERTISDMRQPLAESLHVASRELTNIGRSVSADTKCAVDGERQPPVGSCRKNVDGVVFQQPVYGLR